ncbi:EamA family transporter [Oscillospiraceae bacterium OttesenSCG-928-F05]|nr:EamA family transporter [Oscillospiraceae bacterium OttesenSCG-928-F05]
MWVVYALLSALFAGVMAILAKIGIKNTDSDLATALRTVVVLVFAWLMVFVVGSQGEIAAIDGKSFAFLLLSGLATGGSWLCYFRALQLGDVNKVAPVDKSSVVLTMLLSAVFLGEGMGPIKAAAMVLIGAGTYLMIERKEVAAREPRGYEWLFYAVLSAVFASLTAILGKVGIAGVESNLGTAIRTIVVLLMAWGIVFMQGKQRGIRSIDRRSWLFIVLSGLATGLSWLCYYRALQEGPASVVVPIDKLSILVTVLFGRVMLGERLGRRAGVGLLLIVAGTLSLLV